ncbi:MAG: DUF72 domain-containing protein [Polaromonas sp.]|uniref:DUF72 domain-containing protein n=1 Tax=Polaromonas sp. TaxID=1869339 RepID=UPI00272F80C9|nr:DUF72 domain-containing protein [Polaromonas sp.]MDP2448520.1 DUF72 domain-containing protein [Polaromonas sp.]MDP3245452.1 DUF72 domain-containing protein [Polaromonas sp.]MDP3754939.1 DUF72 domain-containing protein [Polaromonas sp.]MDP3827225.1 DUF72 domain-containing protein [Polaromonas sp.]
MKTSVSPLPAIRVGIGGWTYAPWRHNFYPAKLPHSQELGYASRQLTAIEVNGTYYSSFKPPTFAKWRDETPDDFVLSLKASRFTTNRRVLAEAGESIARFVDSGISELGDKLGPIVWQFMPTKVFDADDFGAFLALLPKAVDGRKLRHVLDVRHPSFMSANYLTLARKYRFATVFTDSPDFPSFADLTSDFVYARLMRSDARLKSGYAPKALDAWAAAAQTWAQGGEPSDLPRVEAAKDKGAPKDVFVFFISGAKERAPAAAMELLQRLGVH